MILEKQATFSEKYRSFLGKGATFSEESVSVAQQNGACVAGFADVGRGEMRRVGEKPRANGRASHHYNHQCFNYCFLFGIDVKIRVV